MKKWMRMSMVVGGFYSAMLLRAEEKKLPYFGQIEYLTYSNALKETEKSFDEGFQYAQKHYHGSGALTGKTKTTGGVGFRIGALASTAVKGLKVGGSLGYIVGPTFEGTVYANGVATVKETTDSNFLRYLAESKYSVPIGEKFQARLGLAFGFASVKITDVVEATGSDTKIDSMTKTQFTWEIGPAIAYVADNVGMELAVTYSQMPSAKNEETFTPFKWNPIGIRLGVEF